MATKKQVEALRWLIEHGHTEAIYVSTLAGMYEERARVAWEAEDHPYPFQATSMRVLGYKRASGAQFERMKDAGLVAWDGWSSYSPKYKITDAGMEAAGWQRGGVMDWIAARDA